MNMGKIRVLVVDSQALHLEGMRAMLSQERDIEVMNGAKQAEQALSQVQATSPDVVVFAPDHATTDTFMLVRRMKQYAPTLPVIILAEPQDQEALLLSIKSGAAAYLTNDASPEELTDTIRRTFHGQYLINEELFSNPKVASQVLRIFQELTVPGEEIRPFLAPLSPRETEVLDLIAQGNSNKDIANQLSISEQTVKNHVASIMRKLVANDRTHAVVIALRQGLIKLK